MISLRKIALLLLVSLYFQRFHQNNEAVRGIEMLFEKIKNHVALLAHIRWLHSHLAKSMLSSCKKHAFTRQKATFYKPKDGILQHVEYQVVTQHSKDKKKAALHTADSR